MLAYLGYQLLPRVRYLFASPTLHMMTGIMSETLEQVAPLSVTTRCSIIP